MTTMLAAVVREPGSVEVIEAEPRERPPDAVRLQLRSAGICGTDLAVVNGTTSLARYPLTLGHEFVGEVEAAPPGSPVAAGDWAAVFPTITCGACRACWTGHENQCAQMRVMGLSDPNGCFAHTVDVRPSQIVPMDAETAKSYGSLIEPLAVACHVVHRAGVRDGDRVLILGSGVIGLTCAIVARALSARQIVLVDRLDRRDAVRALGFENFLQTRTPSELGEHIPAASVDVVLDIVVSNEIAHTAIQTLDRGGRYATVATPKHAHPLELDYRRIYERELSVIATRNYTRGDFARGLALLQSGAADLQPLVTARYPLAELPNALAELRSRPEQHLKIQVTP